MRRSYLRRRELGASDVFRASSAKDDPDHWWSETEGLPAAPAPIDLELPHGEIEARTLRFRAGLGRAHRARVSEIQRAARLALEEWTALVAEDLPPIPCKNWKWVPRAARPARIADRCSAIKRFAGVPHRCAKLAGHDDSSDPATARHEVDRSRVEARGLLRECAGLVGGSGLPCLRLHGHRGECAAARPPRWDRSCPCSLCVLHEATTAVAWHEGRDVGQRERFATVRGCGRRVRTARCGMCGEKRAPVLEGCGVRRVCPRCSVAEAKARRARFGRARGRALIDGARYGLTREIRKGGRYTEKMLTLTIPHCDLVEASGEIARVGLSTLQARVAAAFAAWPRFLRKANRHWRGSRREGRNRETRVAYHRAFEWTSGSDGKGHPHFHVYLWSPWIDVDLLRSWWAEALREIGWPVASDDDGRPIVSVHLRMLRAFDLRAVRELMKGGRRSALTLSRIDFVRVSDGAELVRGRAALERSPGLDAFKYAEGWTLGDVADCGPDVVARLYMALEARRLSQASAEFFVADPLCACAVCGASAFRVSFAPAPSSVELDAVRLLDARAPP